MKPVLRLLPLLVILYAALPAFVSAEKKPVRIGVIASLTGKGAGRGESARQGLNLAHDEIISQGILKEGDFELIYQDVPLNKPAQVTSALHQLIQIEKVISIIGPMGSSPSGAAAPIIDKAQIPAVTHTSSSPTALAGTSYLFRLWPTGKSYANIIAEESKKHGYRRIAILTATHDSPVDVRDFLKAELLKQKQPVIQIVYDEEFTTEDTDFRSALTKLSRLKADALFINLFEGQIGLAAKQARQLGLRMDFFTNAVMSDVELESAAKELEGIWFPRFVGYTSAGRKKFIEKFGKEPPNTESASAAHDALVVVAEAISKVGENPRMIRDFIKDKEGFTGVTGSFRFLENGDATVPIAVHVVKNGEIVIPSQPKGVH